MDNVSVNVSITSSKEVVETSINIDHCGELDLQGWVASVEARLTGLGLPMTLDLARQIREAKS